MTKRQYVNIGNRKLYLNDRGSVIGPHGVTITSEGLIALGLEVETEGPRFEDIEPGVYSPYGGEANRLIRKMSDGDWEKATGEKADPYLLSEIQLWHQQGILYRFNKGEATNA